MNATNNTKTGWLEGNMAADGFITSFQLSMGQGLQHLTVQLDKWLIIRQTSWNCRENNAHFAAFANVNLF
jgi:hypothetical protein